MAEFSIADLLRARDAVASAIEEAMNGNMRPNLAAESLMERGWLDLGAVLGVEDEASEEWAATHWYYPDGGKGEPIPVHLERQTRTGSQWKAWVTYFGDDDVVHEMVVDGRHLEPTS